MKEIWVCTQCPGPIACTFSKSEDRDQFPDRCVPDEKGIVRSPNWQLVPDKKQTKIL